jgi:serine protease Do
MNIKRFMNLALPVVVAAMLVVGSACTLGTTAQSPTNTVPPGASTPVPALGSTPSGSEATPAAPLSPTDFSKAVAQVAQTVKPAVVQITNEQTQLGQFNQPYTVPAGVGSGVIYDSQGHIITNNHVVAGAQKLLVTLPDGRSFDGKLIGTDPQTDLAVVQITGTNLPIAQLGKSSALVVGDWVVAIGNALALSGGPTVTAGVVSALGRTVQEPGETQNSQGPYLFDVIQTDAPINPGNSGGPLVNLAGQVIGINTLVAGSTGNGVQAEGIGFAIAIDTAKPIADQLVATGSVTHPYLGISYVPLNPAIAAQLGTSQTQGVVIMDVSAGSPAAAAGLQPKDVVTEADGKTLQSDSDLAQILNSHKPGDKMTLTVVRGTQTLPITVTLGTRPSA